MRVMSCMLILALVCTTFTGCSLFKKNTNGAQGPAGGAGPAPPKFPGANDPILNSNISPPPAFPAAPPPTPPGPQGAAKGHSTILAGTVTDAYHRPMSNAYIRWVSLDEKDGAPIDVATDARGHFIIQGVKTGQSYKLIARTKQGEKMLAGTVLTSAPNVRVMITIREDLVNSSTPPIPTSPAFQPEPAHGISKNTDADAKGAWRLGQKLKGVIEPNLPATMTVPAAPATGNPAFVPNMVDNTKEAPPRLQIPGKAPPANPSDAPRLPNLAPGDAKLNSAPARVPSCVLVGNHLENLALKDSKGKTWEYRKDALGKLVLLDFWYMQCMPCRESMPALNRLHQQYATRGLEVIGIAIEKGADERKESDAINKFCSSLQIGYRQLIGRSGTFDAGKQFRVNAYPTMMLLSEQGDIIWHHVGRPEPGDMSELERLIQSRLNHKTF